MKKLVFCHITNVKHSGLGTNQIHVSVMNEFCKSIEEGKQYCQQRGWEVELNRGVLSVYSKAPFGFCMTALVQEVE